MPKTYGFKFFNKITIEKSKTLTLAIKPLMNESFGSNYYAQ